MDEEKEAAILDVQRERLSFLVRKSRKLETRLAELRSENHSMELQDVQLAEDYDESELREIKQLIDSVNKLKAEYYCLNYQTNVYNGAIPPGLIDYMPDQPIESTLAVPRSFGQGNQIHPDSPLATSSSDTTSNTTTPTGDTPWIPSDNLVHHEMKDSPSWSCPKCSFSNHPLIGSCEICEHQRDNFSGINSKAKSDNKKCQSSST